MTEADDKHCPSCTCDEETIQQRLEVLELTQRQILTAISELEK